MYYLGKKRDFRWGVGKLHTVGTDPPGGAGQLDGPHRDLGSVAGSGGLVLDHRKDQKLIFHEHRNIETRNAEKKTVGNGAEGLDILSFFILLVGVVWLFCFFLLFGAKMSKRALQSSERSAVRC